MSQDHPCGPSGRAGRVEALYRLGGARWYDPFRALWARLTSSAAEAEIDRLVHDSAHAGCRVLDIGCGTGHNLGRLRRLAVPFKSYRGVDLSESMLAIARRRYADEPRAVFLQGDLHELSDASERFELILCTWVLSHLERPRDALEIAYHLLAPSGRALFLTLTRPRWYVSWWLAPFVRLFQARYVDPAPLRDLPGTPVIHSWAAGLATLVQLQRLPSRKEDDACSGARHRDLSDPDATDPHSEAAVGEPMSLGTSAAKR